MHPHLDTAVEHGHAELAYEWDLPVSHLDVQGVAVNGFDKSGAELAMNGDRGADDAACQLLTLDRHECEDERRDRRLTQCATTAPVLGVVDATPHRAKRATRVPS